MKVYQKLLLDEAWEEAVEKRDEARAKVEDAERLFEANADEIATDSAYRFIMSKETTESVYGYRAVDKYGNVVTDGTTGSSIDFMWKDDTVDTDEETGIVQRVINAIKALANWLSSLGSESNFLKALHNEVSTPSAIGYSSTPAAIGFYKDDAERLFEAQRDLLDAEALVASTTAAALKFAQENATTPTAIKLILPATNEVIYDSAGKTPNAEGFFEVPFELFAGKAFSVKIESTTGAEISYVVDEILTPETSKDHEGTEVYVDGAMISDNAQTTDVQILSQGADAVRFHNSYDDEPYVSPSFGFTTS